METFKEKIFYLKDYGIMLITLALIFQFEQQLAKQLLIVLTLVFGYDILLKIKEYKNENFYKTKLEEINEVKQREKMKFEFESILNEFQSFVDKTRIEPDKKKKNDDTEEFQEFESLQLERVSKNWFEINKDKKKIILDPFTYEKDKSTVDDFEILEEEKIFSLKNMTSLSKKNINLNLPEKQKKSNLQQPQLQQKNPQLDQNQIFQQKNIFQQPQSKQTNFLQTQGQQNNIYQPQGQQNNLFNNPQNFQQQQYQTDQQKIEQLAKEKIVNKLQQNQIKQPLNKIREESPQSQHKNSKMQKNSPKKQLNALNEQETIKKQIEKINQIFLLTRKYQTTFPMEAEQIDKDIKGIFNKICFEIDSHFMQRLKQIYLYLQQRDNENDQFYYSLKVVYMKIFQDIRSRFKSSKIVIIYYATFIVLMNQQLERISDIFLGIIFRKFQILAGILEEQKSSENEYLLSLGFDKREDKAITKPEEDYPNMLEGYSMLFFGIIGCDLENQKIKHQININFGESDKTFDYSHFYFDFLEKLKKIQYWKHPFLVFVLKTYILCSSELFYYNKNQFLENFKFIQNEMLPKIEDELKNFETRFTILNNVHKKEIQICISVLKKLLKEVITTEIVKDKYIEYDKEARGDQQIFKYQIQQNLQSLIKIKPLINCVLLQRLIFIIMYLWEGFKIFYFGYITCLSYIITLWPLTILPEIMQVDFKLKNGYDVGIACKNFYTMFFWGMIVGAFIWPTLTKYLSLRNSILSGLVVQLIATYVMSKTSDLETIFFLRFVCGLVMNINNVGKAFIFQFAHKDLVQWGFSSKNIWGIIASFATPILGYKLFNLLDKSFESVCVWVAGLYFVSIIVYWLTFYVFWTMPKPEQNQEEEEKKELINKDQENGNLEEQEEKEDQTTLWGITKFVLRTRYLRNFLVVYMLTNGIFKTMNLLSVLFLERSQQQNGLGIDAESISYVAIISMVPSVAIVFISPFFVPSKISYQQFIGFVVFCFTCATIIIPLLGDISHYFSKDVLFYIACINQSTIYWATPKIFSPFMSYIVGTSVPKKALTAVNSLAFILSTGCSAILMNVCSQVYVWSMDTKFGESLMPYNKYISFGVVILLLLIAQVFLYNTHDQ